MADSRRLRRRFSARVRFEKIYERQPKLADVFSERDRPQGEHSMTSYILIFMFTLSDGRQIRATQDAVHLEEYRPVKTLAGCQKVADLREARMNVGFAAHPSLVQTVMITCEKANPRKRK